jgi:hypothetical protein
MRVLVLALLVATLAACGESDPQTAERPAGAWDRLPDPPLSPREMATGLSIAGEAVFAGGSDDRPCPAGADCVAPSGSPLRDGAAFDPRLHRWQRIAPAPVGFSFAYTAVLDGAAYLLVPGEPGRPEAPAAFLRYRLATDRWTRLALPPDPRRRAIVATGGQIIAYAESDESGRIPDLAFDPATGRWDELPDDPLPPSYGRSMAWSGTELVLFAAEIVPQPGSSEPSVIIAAAFDPERRTWRRLPDSEMLGGGARWFAHDGRLIFPALGSAEGGEVGTWDHAYPNGGMLDVARSRWLPLPDAPGGESDFAAGIVAGEKADYFGARGWVLDAGAGTWTRVPSLDGEDAQVDRGIVTAAGRDLIVFGGVRWSEGPRGELLNDAWIWR